MASDPPLPNNVVDFKSLAGGAEGRRLLDKGVEPGGGGGNSGGMDGLVAKVEALDRRVERVESRLDRLDERANRIEVGVAEIKGKIDGLAGQIGQLERTAGQLLTRLPSWWQMPAVIVTVIVACAAAVGTLKTIGAI